MTLIKEIALSTETRHALREKALDKGENTLL
jgi:hypothetical protein